MTNYEKIKSMSIEELAACYARNMTCGRCGATKMCQKSHTDSEIRNLSCSKRIQKWLNSEAEK